MSFRNLPNIFDQGKHYCIGKHECGYVGRDSEARHVFVKIFSDGRNYSEDEYELILIKPGTFISDGRALVAMENNPALEVSRKLTRSEVRYFNRALQHRVQKMVGNKKVFSQGHDELDYEQ